MPRNMESPGEGTSKCRGRWGSQDTTFGPHLFASTLNIPASILLWSFLREPLHKQFLSEENMTTHFSRLSLHNDHPYCSPPVTFPEALPPLR